MTADAIADGPVPDDAEELEEPREHTRLGQYRLVQRIGALAAHVAQCMDGRVNLPQGRGVSTIGSAPHAPVFLHRRVPRQGTCGLQEGGDDVIRAGALF